MRSCSYGLNLLEIQRGVTVGKLMWSKINVVFYFLFDPLVSLWKSPALGDQI